MEFNGAVLVANQKIENALKNYTSLKREYEKEIKRCEDKLASQLGDLSWWDNYICNDGDEDWFKVYKRKYNGQYYRCFSNNWLDNFQSVGLVSEESYKKLKDMGENCYRYTKQFWPLSSLIRAGTPVYLNPEQADFVNTFYKSVDTSG